MARQEEVSSLGLVSEIRMRELLLSFLRAKGTHQIIEEVGSPRLDVFYDVVALGNTLIGFEIKSDYDELSRLPAQVRAYQDVFDYNYLVVGKVHLEKGLEEIPSSWGVFLSLEDRLVEIRKPQLNLEKDNYEKMRYLDTHQVKSITKKQYSKEFKRILHENVSTAIVHSILEYQKETGDAFIEDEINEFIKQTLLSRKEKKS